MLRLRKAKPDMTRMRIRRNTILKKTLVGMLTVAVLTGLQGCNCESSLEKSKSSKSDSGGESDSNATVTEVSSEVLEKVTEELPQDLKDFIGLTTSELNTNELNKKANEINELTSDIDFVFNSGNTYTWELFGITRETLDKLTEIIQELEFYEFESTYTENSTPVIYRATAQWESGGKTVISTSYETMDEELYIMTITCTAVE
jgi:hypothetical protein